MAIPDNYIDKITKGNDSRMISPAADMVRVDNDNFEGETLDEVLDDVARAISEAGEVKSVSVNNGTPAQPDSNGNVNIQVQTGSTISPASAAPSMDGTANVGSSDKYAREDHVHPHDSTKLSKSDVSVETQGDGTVDLKVKDDTYTIDLNHEHPQYQRLLTAGANITIAENAQTGEIVISSSGGGSAALTGVSFNGVPATVVNGVATITATIPANVSELNNDSGYVKYVLLADEAAYTALSTKDSGTLYLIPES